MSVVGVRLRVRMGRGICLCPVAGNSQKRNQVGVA